MSKKWLFVLGVIVVAVVINFAAILLEKKELTGNFQFVYSYDAKAYDNKIESTTLHLAQFKAKKFSEPNWNAPDIPDAAFVTAQGIYVDDNNDGNPDLDRDADKNGKPDGPLTIDQAAQYISQAKAARDTLIPKTEEVIQKRLNHIGCKNISFRRENDNRLVVEIQTVPIQLANTSTIERVINYPGFRIELHLVNNDPNVLIMFQQEPDRAKIRYRNYYLTNYNEERFDEDGNTRVLSEPIIINKQNALMPDDFESVEKARSPHSDEYQINFCLTPQGGVNFKRVTRENIGSRLAILCNDRVISAPRIVDEVGREGVITGNLTEAEIDAQVAAFYGGNLPVTLELVSKKGFNANGDNKTKQAGNNSKTEKKE